MVGILEKYYNNEDYYILNSLSDKSLNIKIPITSNKIRNIITKDEFKTIIANIPIIEIIKDNDRLIENNYKTLMQSGKHEDLIKIIKTTYLRNEQRLNNNKKISEIDDTYFKKAEKYLYNEFSIVLNKSFDETKEYIINILSNN
ncbi:MAG: hypothetical protein IJD92_00520 [Bacilli bacterium]|nr:hypothetical protein [Bacilli bacterium]